MEVQRKFLRTEKPSERCEVMHVEKQAEQGEKRRYVSKKTWSGRDNNRVWAAGICLICVLCVVMK